VTTVFQTSGTLKVQIVTFAWFYVWTTHYELGAAAVFLFLKTLRIVIINRSLIRSFHFQIFSDRQDYNFSPLSAYETVVLNRWDGHPLYSKSSYCKISGTFVWFCLFVLLPLHLQKLRTSSVNPKVSILHYIHLFLIWMKYLLYYFTTFSICHRLPNTHPRPPLSRAPYFIFSSFFQHLHHFIRTYFNRLHFQRGRPKLLKESLQNIGMIKAFGFQLLNTFLK